MRTLSAHLRAPDDHGRLPFHPRCPICRQERLAGTLTTAPVVSHRTRAALAAGVLVLSGAAPSAALAAEGDQEQDGTAPAAQPGGGDPAESPNFDPGGDSTDLPFNAAPSPEAQAPPDPGNDDTAPLDEDPATDPGAPVADPGDGSTAPVAQQPEQAPAAPPPAPVAGNPEQTASTPSPVPAPSPPSSTPAPPPAAPTVVGGGPQVTPSGKKPRRKNRHPGRTGGSVTSQGPAAPASSPSPPIEATATQPVPSTTPVVTGKRARPGDRSHRVLAGESLWSIASDLLGGAASPARVASEVHRLWGLNRGRIGTGDPDLLMVGTTLRLR